MDFKKLVTERVSTRKYKSIKVESNKISDILEYSRMAPSAVNRQPWRVIAIDEPNMLGEIQKSYHREWFRTAPCVLVIFGDHDTAWKRGYDNKDHTDIDVAIFIDHITLMAAEMGLGSCWVCNFEKDIVNDIIKQPSNWEPIALLPIGYSDDEKKIIKNRKSVDDILSYNKW